LTRPNAAFLAGLGEATPIFEKKFQQEHGAKMGQPGVLTMGTGPFEIDSWDPTKGMELSANPYWWGGKVPVQHVTVDFFTTETQLALAMRAGEINVAFPTSAGSFASTAGVKVESVPSLDAVSYFVMNPDVAPWNNIYVRRAVAYALDRQDIINSIGNPAVPTSTFIPVNQFETIASTGQADKLLGSVTTYQYDLAKAKSLMAESPYPHGFSATTDTLEYGYYTPVCEAIAGELAKIGIKLSIKELTFNQWIAYAIGPKTYGNLYVDFNPAISDPSGMPDWILGSKNIANGEWNMAAYNPAGMDNLITAGISTNDVAKRLPIYGEIMRTVAADVPYVPLFVPDENVAVSTNFTIAKGLNIAFPYYQAWELYIRPR
jgi:peptide/nickel transport system substrate-binding protein